MPWLPKKVAVSPFGFCSACVWDQTPSGLRSNTRTLPELATARAPWSRSAVTNR